MFTGRSVTITSPLAKKKIIIQGKIPAKTKKEDCYSLDGQIKGQFGWDNHWKKIKKNASIFLKKKLFF